MCLKIKLKMEKKRNEWFVLAILIVCFIPVIIDSTILHMAIPTLTFELKATGNQVLWMIDIYSLIMAGLLLPMGVLGDKIGHKRVLFAGVIIFLLASITAGYSQMPWQLIASRVFLAVGGSMIMPTTLAIIRQNFPDDQKRAIALGIWVVFANVGAAVGPIIGGLLIDTISWRAIFFINIPLLVIVAPFVVKGLPQSITNPNRKWAVKDALVLLFAIIILVYFIKNIFNGGENIVLTCMIGLIGGILLFLFIKMQKKSDNPMLDKSLLSDKRVQIGMLFIFIPMVITSGFELLLSQELQLVHNIPALKTALYISPFFISFAVPGLFSGILMKKLGIYGSKILGLMLTTIGFICLGFSDFGSISVSLIIWLFIGGFGLGLTMLAASYSIMSAATDDNAGTAGSLESTAYELGVGLGVTFFGILLSQVFAKTLVIPEAFRSQLPKEVYYSFNDALVLAEEIKGPMGQTIKTAALPAFAHAHSIVLIISGIITALFMLYLFVNRKQYK